MDPPTLLDQPKVTAAPEICAVLAAEVKMSAQRELIVGGTGFIGTWVVRLLADGHHVTVYHRG